MRAWLLAFLSIFGVHTPALSQPPEPPKGALADTARCQWEWKSGGGIGVWAERCALDTGVWELSFREDLPGFVLTVDGQREATVLQLFKKPADAGIAAILPELRRRGYIPDDALCAFGPAAITSAPRTAAFFDIRPTGERKTAFEATPADEVPEPACGEYGWSTHGIRYFLTDIRHADSVVFINTGQDGMMFDARTVTIE